MLHDLMKTALTVSASAILWRRGLKVMYSWKSVIDEFSCPYMHRCILTSSTSPTQSSTICSTFEQVMEKS